MYGLMAPSPFQDKSVLITGGTGSFGQALAKRLLQEDLCSKVIIFSRDEWKQSEMRESDPLFNSQKIRYFLGDVRDAARLRMAFREVQIVVHAAALKQVPAAEYNPSEFVNTNILGAMNVIDAAINRGIERVIALSTDKAVNPVNLYGATKLCADKLFIAGNAYVGDQGTKFSVVRYGNVIGSRGSIIPLWKKMIAHGEKELPITDPEMTRFWITLNQAVDFTCHVADWMEGEEIFVPKIPSIKTIDLERALAPQIATKVIGIREGEKIHEVLISNEQAPFTFEFDSHYLLLPPVHKRTLQDRIDRQKRRGKLVPPNFAYTSDNNPVTITEKELQRMLAEIH